MTQNVISASRQFSIEDQRAFAELSGDANPMHVDPLYARRTQAGAPVVHGIHAVMWALDQVYASGFTRRCKKLRVRFERFLYLEEMVESVAMLSSDELLEIELMVEGQRVMAIKAELGDPSPGPVYEILSHDAPLEAPLLLALDNVAGAKGAFAFGAPMSAFSAAFPALVAAIGASSAASLAGISTLVGMHCPGLDSIFSKLMVEFVHDDVEPGGLQFEVRRLQLLLRTAVIDARAPGLIATIEAFVRQPPVRQPSASEMRALVTPDAFAGARVLIVGGSRGLGELAAKLLAAGGAEVLITYARGESEAALVAAEIEGAGGYSETLPLDVSRPIAEQLDDAGKRITHCYYFATPQIFRRRVAVFSEAVLAEFMHFYVNAFYELADALATEHRPIRLFYPSSVAVDERPKGATEYAMAKAAGEILCANLTRDHPGIEVVSQRLPRLLTDQTATVLPVATVPAIDVLLPIVRTVQGNDRPSAAA